MSFTQEQNEALAADLSRSHVATRTQAGRSLFYIEGWHAIAEANRIFGFDGWSSETFDIGMVHQAPTILRTGDGWTVSYIARVRVRVGGITREGTGAGHGKDKDLGLAHESAIKEAETDARKRALMTFGNQFGLALYDRTQSSVSDDDAPQPSLSQSPKPKQEEPAPRVSAPVETDTQSSRPETAISRTAVARVAAPPSRADAIPTVAPSKPRSDLTADAMIRDLRGRNGAIISGRRNGKPADFEAECQAHELWCGTAKTLWSTLEAMDQRRVKAEREKLESTIAEAKKKTALRRPKTHTVDPDTGEVLEAAE